MPVLSERKKTGTTGRASGSVLTAPTAAVGHDAGAAVRARSGCPWQASSPTSSLGGRAAVGRTAIGWWSGGGRVVVGVDPVGAPDRTGLGPDELVGTDASQHGALVRPECDGVAAGPGAPPRAEFEAAGILAGGEVDQPGRSVARERDGVGHATHQAVEGVDFENIGEDELASVMAELEAASGETTAEIDGLQCPSPEGSDDEALAAVIALAEREAPGTVGYLEWIAAFAAGFPDLGEASGDCEADMAALQSVVDDGRTMSDLTMAQVVEVAGLAASVSTNCNPERAEEFFARKDVAAFLEEG